MKLTIEGTSEEIKKVLQAIASSQEQITIDFDSITFSRDLVKTYHGEKIKHPLKYQVTDLSAIFPFLGNLN
jgi:hypothetical protein